MVAEEEKVFLSADMIIHRASVIATLLEMPLRLRPKLGLAAVLVRALWVPLAPNVWGLKLCGLGEGATSSGRAEACDWIKSLARRVKYG